MAAVALAIMLLILFMPGDDGDGQPSDPLPGSLLSVNGSIESNGAQDTFTASVGQQVLFDARECASSGLLVGTLRRPDEEPVFENETLRSGGSLSDLTRTLPQTGTIG